MSTVIGVMGQSGHGKSTSLRTLEPASTFYINADGKPLPWRGWTKQYNEVAGNYLQTRDASAVQGALTRINDQPEIKVIVIDTINAVMIHEEFTRMREKGYDKWIDICQFVYDLIVSASELRQDLTVVLLFHVAVNTEGEGVDHILTNGRKLEKVHLEFLLTILVYAKSRMVDGANQYVFEVQANSSTAKTPMGLFETMEIPNDMKMLCDAVTAYQDGDELPGRESQPVVTEQVESGNAGGDEIATLIALMAIDGVSNQQLSEMCTEKKWLKKGDRDFAHLSPDVLGGMIKPENWLKVRFKLVAHLKGIKTAMEVSGVTTEKMNAYCEEKKFGAPWYDVDADILRQMLKPKNWDKVAAKAATL